MMVSRWHLLHLPVTLQEKPGQWGWVENVSIRWPEGVLEGIGVRYGFARCYIAAANGALTVTRMGIRVRQEQSLEKHSHRWWKMFHHQEVLMNQPVWAQNGELLGRITDVLIDEDSLVVHDLVVSRGILEDLLHGALLVSRREFEIDSDGRIKISPHRAV